jgi:hypothetical protein
MTIDGAEGGRLREAFVLSESLPGPREECPAPERLWESVHEHLRAAENETLIRHLTTCAPCSTAWRVARDLAGAEAAMPQPVLQRRLDWRGWAPLAAAAILIVAVGLTLEAVRVRPTAPPAYRSEQGSWIRPAGDAPAALPRDGFLLRWSAGPEGSTYDVRVIATGHGPIARGYKLERPEFRVPPSSLAGAASGTKVLWQVTAYLPDGRVSDSATFIVQVE